MTKKASIIVPTRNRAGYLSNAIQSFINQDYSFSDYEIIVVDNASTDNTRKVFETIRLKYPNCNLKYYFEPVPGLLSGRHRGAIEADGDILIFVDDDIEALKFWLSEIMLVFRDEQVHLVGGPSFPKFEVTPPEWISQYCKMDKYNTIISPLSLIYLGNKKKIIDPKHVWGLNYSIRKKTFFDLGGFHPDCIPKQLQCFQGDGETGLSSKIQKNGLKTIYSPKAAVYHNIPRTRLTVSYFKDRFYYQGVCDSYTQIRKFKGLSGINVPEYPVPDCQKLTTMNTYDKYKQIIYQHIRNAYVAGFRFHKEAVKKKEALLKWVLRENYFDYKLPNLNNNNQLVTPIEANKSQEKNLILIVATAHRVGSTWLFNMLKGIGYFNYNLNLMPKKFYESGTGVLQLNDYEVFSYLNQLKGRVIFKSHSYPVTFEVPEYIKFLTVVRDPRDVVISNSFYLAHLDEKLGGWGDDFRNLSELERIINIIKNGEFILSRLEKWFKTSSAYKVKYEELKRDPVEKIISIFKYLDIAANENSIKTVVEQHSFKARTGRKPGEERKESPQRKGVIGDWKNYFNKDCIEAFKNEYNGRWNNLLIEMGYENTLDW